MSNLTINNATDVYSIAGRCSIYRHKVDHAGLCYVSRSLRALIQSLNADSNDEYWHRTLSPIRRFTYSLCSVPLPFTLISENTGINWEKLHAQVRICGQLFPNHAHVLLDLIQHLDSLKQESKSPLIPPLEDLHAKEATVAVLIANPRLNRLVVDYFSSTPSLRDLKVISPLQLRGTLSCTTLAVMGPCGWFPEFVFSAPRVPAIHVIAYRWINDSWTPGRLFLGCVQANGDQSSVALGKLPALTEDNTTINNVADVSPFDLLPVRSILKREALGHDTIRNTDINGTIPAKLCHLIGDRGVFVSSEEGATSLIIDPHESGSSAVRRVPTSELESGHYILLRTSGGGDFIAPLADRIMGRMAVTRRSQQSYWKDQVRQKAVIQFGSLPVRELAYQICHYLKRAGLSQVLPTNIYYWMLPKCIRPRRQEDFYSILAYAGLESNADELWTAMGEIDQAHKKAGFAIRKMLLERITCSPLEQLERDGVMEFNLGDEGGGTLSAFQIAEMFSDNFEVPPDRIGILLDFES